MQAPMSQNLVLRMLTDLDGRATASQIRKAALQQYPGTTLHTYVTKRLKALQKWDTVRERDGYWEIIEKRTEGTRGAKSAPE